MKALFFKWQGAFLATRFGGWVNGFLASWPVLLLLASMQLYYCIAGAANGNWFGITIGLIGLIAGLWNMKDRRKRDLHLRSLLPLRVRVWLSHPFISR